ncbi:hypothetical protein [Flavihumibacter sp. CACIAM 22H1]|uniref:hypothetical protein n=1 Tax=Flavihumibacter sp. CACIAM 22H1 TaxID=1812911 RepID=UPI0007A92E2F|nr:hypothetical protein [Flavihumibacter sp. CACIAM 22H1]KYP15528.1 MAG: hypothetical protein A1D16_21420 [Flavihumibacter sp. CACIAM 22H1]
MIKRHLRYFWNNFTRPRVLSFLLIGTAVVFLTFLTNDNALEISISGLASVFIGIAVNNFTAEETRHKDEIAIRSKVTYASKVLEMAEAKLQYICTQSATGNQQQAEDACKELSQLLGLLKLLLKEEKSLH